MKSIKTYEKNKFRSPFTIICKGNSSCTASNFLMNNDYIILRIMFANRQRKATLTFSNLGGRGYRTCTPHVRQTTQNNQLSSNSES